MLFELPSTYSEIIKSLANVLAVKVTACPKHNKVLVAEIFKFGAL